MKYVLLTYNNYDNRQIKRFSSLADYLSNSSHSEIKTVKDFPYGNYVNTQVNVQADRGNLYDYYLLLNDDETIDSRWHIVGSQYLSKKNEVLTLRRDVIADFYGDILNSPIIYSKFPVEENDPQIFNPEQISYNKIKKQELPIQSADNLEWIVGYIPATSIAETTTVKITAPDQSGIAYLKFASDSAWKASAVYKKFYGKITNYAAKKRFGFCLNMPNDIGGLYLANDDISSMQLDLLANDSKQAVIFDRRYFDGSAFGYVKATGGKTGTLKYLDGTTPETIDSKDLAKSKCAETKYQINLLLNSQTGLWDAYDLSEADVQQLGTLKDKVISIGGNTYRFKVKTMSEHTVTAGDDTNYGALATLIHASLEGRDDVYASTNEDDYFVRLEGSLFYCYLEETEVTVNVPLPSAAERTHADNALYDIFAIPYSEESIFVNSMLGTMLKGPLAPWIATRLTTEMKLNESEIYDLQKVPYISQEKVAATGGINVIYDQTTIHRSTPIIFTNITGADIQDITDESGNVVQKIYWLKNCEGHFDIDLSIPATGLQKTKKLSSMLDSYRIVSPQYQSIFEFSPAKNDGVDSFHIDFTLKPWKPYFKVAPNFKGLYGSNFEDARGCILSDDFSLPQITSAWANYVQNNKNYQNAFNREIQSMDIQHGYDRATKIVSAITGAISGGTGGAYLGGASQAMTGSNLMKNNLILGTTGAAIGAGVAGAASFAGGITDVALSEKSYQESKQLKIDSFNMSLENIRSIPESISKAASFNYNTKSAPYVEVCSCTPEEVEQANSYLEYNGYSVNLVKETTEPKKSWDYYEGQLLRYSWRNASKAIYDAINEELSLGVYLNSAYLK